MSIKLPRGREAAQEQADMLVQQIIIVLGVSHPLATESKVLAEKIRVDNAEYVKSNQ